MQERLLACRIVHFLPDEIFFECRQTSNCECGLTNDIGPNFGMQRTLWPSLENSKPALYYFRREDASLWDQWQTIATGFSKLKLTYADDALPALSGIAKRALQLRPGSYLAGIWEVGIALHLSWRSCDSPTETNPVEQSSAAFRPTFSWISHPGPIEYPVIEKETKSICTYLSGGSTKSTADPFGRISHAFICLKGHSIRALDLFNRLGRGTYRPSRLTMPPLDDPTVYIDSGGEFTLQLMRTRPGLLSYSDLMKLQDWSSARCFGFLQHKFSVITLLLLQPASDGSSFVRIGLVEGVNDSWFFRNAIECSITIV